MQKSMPTKTEHPSVYERLPVFFDVVLIIVTVVGLAGSLFLPSKLGVAALAALSFIGLLPVLWSALRALLKRRLTIDLLASIALIFSLLAREWFSAAFITLMLAFARLFDQWTTERTKKIITHLLKFRPHKVKVLRGDNIREENLSEVKVGDRVLVESGDRVPVDGTVVKGEAALNQSSLTGESELVTKKVGDEVFTSTLSESGSLVVLAKKVGNDTTLSKIIALVEEASRKRSKSERVADRFTQYYIVVTIIAATAMFVFGLSPKMILSVLLVVCADDIAVAVPLGFTAAIAKAARRGVVIKGSEALEKLSRLKYVITDKTGTLTYGRPRLVSVIGFGGRSEDEILRRLAVGASSSRHPTSGAISAEAKKRGITISHMPDEFKEVPGSGMEFIHDGEKMFSGKMEYLERSGIEISETKRQAISAECDLGRSVNLLSINGELAGLVSSSDEIKSNAKAVIEETKRLGVKEWHILTGDNEKVARAVAGELGIRHYHSNLTPEAKVAFVEKFEREKRGVVGMIGDGVNDAASLALVDVSIAMGTAGTDAAIEAADIAIMHDNLMRIPESMKLSRSAMIIMRENFGIWALTNGLGLALVFLGVLGPAGAATYNFLTDFLPIGNALRVLR